MKRLLCFLISMMFIGNAYALQQVELISRFGPTTLSGKLALQVVNMLNEEQKDYEFKLSVNSGANGEVADQRAITLARNGQKVLLWQTISSFTFNRFLVGNTYDRDYDLIPLQGMTAAPFSIMVAPESPIENYEDLIQFIKNKPIVYWGGSANGSSMDILLSVFLKSNGINNVKVLSYEKPYDITRGILSREVDFTIFNPIDLTGLKQLVTSNPERIYNYKNVPTGIEVGMKDFVFNSQNIISVPKEQAEFGEQIKPLLARICYDKRFLEIMGNVDYISSCSGTQSIKRKIKEENELIAKYKDSVVPK